MDCFLRYANLCAKVSHLATAAGKSEKQTFLLAVARKRRPWFEGLWANAGEPLTFADSAKKS